MWGSARQPPSPDGAPAADVGTRTWDAPLVTCPSTRAARDHLWARFGPDDRAVQAGGRLTMRGALVPARRRAA